MKKEKEEEINFFLEKIGVSNPDIIKKIVRTADKQKSVKRAIDTMATGPKAIEELRIASQTLASEIERIDAI
jgi:hypothetical protein